MLPNPLSPAAAGSDAARPQLRLAARAESHADRELPPIVAAVQEIVQRSHGEWRGTLDSIKETLATLERNCASAIEAQEAGVTGLIDTLVGSAAAEADAAARQAQAQAQIEIEELQRALVTLHTLAETLKTDLDAERDNANSIQSKLEMEVAARVRAETERDEARGQCQHRLAEAEAQITGLRSESEAQKAALALLRTELDAAVAERSKLMATFQMVQRALALGGSANAADAVEAAGNGRAAAAEYRSLPTYSESSPTPELTAAASSPVVDARNAIAELHPEASEDAKRVLEQVEAMYQLDLSSGRPGMEIVDSLTGSLRYGRDAIVGRWDGECDAEAVFECQVDALLNTHAGTSFGRHLSIAAYESRQRAVSPTKTAQGPLQADVS